MLEHTASLLLEKLVLAAKALDTRQSSTKGLVGLGTLPIQLPLLRHQTLEGRAVITEGIIRRVIHLGARRTDVVARRHTTIKEVLILTTGVAGYFDGKFVPSNSTIAAIVGARFLRTTLSHAVRRHDRRVYREEEAERLPGMGRRLLAVFQGCREKARSSGRRP